MIDIIFKRLLIWIFISYFFLRTCIFVIVLILLFCCPIVVDGGLFKSFSLVVLFILQIDVPHEENENIIEKVRFFFQ